MYIYMAVSVSVVLVGKYSSVFRLSTLEEILLSKCKCFSGGNDYSLATVI